MSSVNRERMDRLSRLETGLAQNYADAANLVSPQVLATTDPFAAFEEVKREYETGQYTPAEAAQIGRLANMARRPPLNRDGMPEFQNPDLVRRVYGRTLLFTDRTEGEVPQNWATIDVALPNMPPRKRLYGFLWGAQEAGHHDVTRGCLEQLGLEPYAIKSDPSKVVQGIGHLNGVTTAAANMLASAARVRGYGWLETVWDHNIATRAAVNEHTTLNGLYKPLREGLSALGEEAFAEITVRRIIGDESGHFAHQQYDGELAAASLTPRQLTVSKRILERSAKLVGVAGSKEREAQMGELVIILSGGEEHVTAVTDDTYEVAKRLTLTVSDDKFENFIAKSAQKCVSEAMRTGFDATEALDLLAA